MRFIVSMVFWISAGLPASALEYISAPYVRVVGAEALSVRSGPSAHSHKLGEIGRAADGVENLGCTSSGEYWCRVRSDQLVGWVSAKYLANVRSDRALTRQSPAIEAAPSRAGDEGLRRIEQLPVNPPSFERPAPAAIDDLAVGEIVGATRTEALHSGPRWDAQKLTNEKATSALGVTVFQEIDTTTTVRVLRLAPGWLEVQIEQPSWLSSHRGWVPRDALRSISRTTDGKRTFVEADFLWDDDMAPHKRAIVATVNRISREDASCAEISPSSTSSAAGRGTPSQPVFYVVCRGADGKPFNVWFGVN